jgi:hypothetical protein
MSYSQLRVWLSLPSTARISFCLAIAMSISMTACVNRNTSKSLEIALAPDPLLQSPSPTSTPITESPTPTTESPPAPNPESPTPVTESPTPVTESPTPNYLTDLSQLKSIDLPATNPQRNVTRAEYARWLVSTYNQIDRRQPAQQLQLAPKDAKPVFTDVPATHPDFPAIQGLAEGGFIPSTLSGDKTATLFRPDAPLVRQSLIQWKSALDARKSLPQTSIASINRTWGFQDASKIDPSSLSAIEADYHNGNNSNIRRTFGYITLFQPQKTVTITEVAATLWYFGTANEGRSAQEARIEDRG